MGSQMSEASQSLKNIVYKHKRSGASPQRCGQCWDAPFPCSELQAARLALAAPMLAEALAGFVGNDALHSIDDCLRDVCERCKRENQARTTLAAIAAQIEATSWDEMPQEATHQTDGGDGHFL